MSTLPPFDFCLFFLFSIGASIQSRFRWSMLRSDLLTVINELFRWFSRFYRLFFPSHLTSCYTVAHDSSFCTRWSEGVAFSLSYSAVRLLYRRSLPPPVISSLLPLPFFRLSSFYRRIRAGMASSQLCSTFSVHLHNVSQRVLTRESMSLTAFPSHVAAFNPRARIYPTCQLQYTRHIPY